MGHSDSEEDDAPEGSEGDEDEGDVFADAEVKDAVMTEEKFDSDDQVDVKEEAKQDGPSDSLALPTPEEQKDAMVHLDNTCPMKEGETWCLVYYRWLEAFKSYTGYVSTSYRSYYVNTYRRYDPPGPIDNTFLLLDGQLRREMREDCDYSLVHERQWELLHGWYGGGPKIARKVIAISSYYGRLDLRVEVHLLRVKLVRSTKLDSHMTIQISKEATIKQLMDAVLATYDVQREQIRLWDYHGDTRLKLLEDMDSLLSECQIIDQQKILVEEKETNGSWPVVKSQNTYNSYYGSSYSYGGGGSYYDGTRQPTTAGLAGLRNLGNTCFMNSAIQCLSNTYPLRKFFTSKKYKDDVNTTNVLGAGGELAVKFAELMDEMWGGEYSVCAPRNLKSKIERLAPQFAGYNQHDGQELLMYLLDGLHEDLNRVKTKQFVEKLESDGRPDEIVARESWEGHMKRNDSIVVDLFQAQLKSTLVCPDESCKRVSITFDPYMCLSVPVPVPKNRLIKVIFFWCDASITPLRVRVACPKTGKISDLKAELSKIVNVDKGLLFVAEVFSYRFFKEYCDDDDVMQIREDDTIYGIELPRQPEADPNDPPEEEESQSSSMSSSSYAGGSHYTSYSAYGTSSYYGSSSSYGGSSYNKPKRYPTGKPGKIVHIRVMQRKLASRQLFALPFVLSVPRDYTYRQLYRAMIVQLQRRLNTELPELKPFFASPPPRPPRHAPPPPPSEDTPSPAADVTSEPMLTSSDLKIDEFECKGEVDNEYDESADDDEGAAMEDGEEAFEPIFRMVVTNDLATTEKLVLRDGPGAPLSDFAKDTIFVVLEWSTENYEYFYNSEPDRRSDHESMEIDERKNTALSLYDCLNLFIQPEQLSPDDTWYCSRCKQHQQATKEVLLYSCPKNLVIHLKRFSASRDKLDMLITYPIHDLDLSKYVCLDKERAKYDLYAVSCHFGGVGGGHYTAYAKNITTGKWYNFDDSSVSEAAEASLVTSAGYVLFYRRKDHWENLENEEDSLPSANGDQAQTQTQTQTESVDANPTSSGDEEPVKGYDEEVQASANYMASSLLEDGKGLD